MGMTAQLIPREQVEFMERLRTFKNTPPNERTTLIPGMTFRGCDDEDVGQLFNVFCYGEFTEVEAAKFIDHFAECALCWSGFVRLIWATTDYNGH